MVVRQIIFLNIFFFLIFRIYLVKEIYTVLLKLSFQPLCGGFCIDITAKYLIFILFILIKKH